ncbi:hypothetical protein K439DRAFT_1628691 [Ramaria rubella]|nr:hypothetical protein K439DRAFT_1628691 [Ramaria rubella]
MHIPTENLSLIVQYALQDLNANPSELGDQIVLRHGDGLSTRLLAGFSLASQKLRQIALREIFKTYNVATPSHLRSLDDFPNMYRWVRVLHCPVNIALQATEQQYARFTYLHSVHLWGDSNGLVSVLQRLPISVQQLTLPFDHAHDHTSVLTSTCRFENLTCLRVTRSLFEVPPAVEELDPDIPPHHHTYSRIAADLLSPLRSLRILQIDHYLTDIEVYDFHATRCSWSSASSAFCPTCWERFGKQTANAEIACTEILAHGLRNLELVKWKSWFTVNAEGYSRLFITRKQSPGSRGYHELQIRRERDSIEAEWKRVESVSKKCHKRIS